MKVYRCHYICSKCGSHEVYFIKGSKNKVLRKVKCMDCGYISTFCFMEIKKALKEHLKPWKDSESLFCDTEFLKQLINKDPSPGKECKDV